MKQLTLWIGRCLLLLAFGSFIACQSDTHAGLNLPETIDFNIHVKPILSDRCFACHGPDQQKQKAGLALHEPDRAFAALQDKPGHFALVPGKPHKSTLYQRIISDDPEYLMPPPESNLSLSPYEIAILEKWIDQGAEYKPHWAFIAPTKPAVPEVQQSNWAQTPIDNFVMARLERESLQPAPKASREALLRRVSFDLTGLPPTQEAIEAFVQNEAPDSYEKVVDELLASPHYGEKMATDWLDLARYADTHGYTVDRTRDMSPWRDWVIKALNENIPYDQFVTWQLAGDLLPQPTREQQLATAFNRNHAQNMEGGIVNEEFRVEYVIDRASTLGTAFLGLTLQCARCHDHKYDPISQKEFYQFYSFFNNVEEAGQISWDNATPVPTMLLSDEEVDAQIAFLDQEIEQEKDKLEASYPRAESDFADHLAHGAPKQVLDNSLPRRGLVAHFPLEGRGSTLSWRNQAPGHSEKAKVAEAEVVAGKSGKGLKLNGDDIFLMEKVGIFGRSQPFSVGIWVNIPEELENGMIIHKGKGAIIYNWRGYHIAVRDNKIELMMAHTWPYNAIIELSEQEVPKGEWVHLMMTYDGSSKAAGLKLWINGELAPTEVETDNLYKDILFDDAGNDEGLKVGARWRGTGLKDGLVDEITVYDEELTMWDILRIAGKQQIAGERILQLDTHPEWKEEAFRGFMQTRWKPYQNYLTTVTRLRTKRNQLIESIPELMVMAEMAEPRQAYILERGLYDAYGEPVQADTPDRILSFPDSLPRNRLGLAKWLMLPENPLMARVTVNRYWQQFFGQGLVISAEDFGNQGNLPTHPELLDWLAVTFRESGWDLKALHKQFVMSATYQQASVASPELLEKDPANLLLARGPARRLSAEMLRDNALAGSGLLVPKIGGPSVKPYQPKGLYAFNPGGGPYVEDEGEKRYRRSLYTFWKRTILHPTLNTFDAPDRSYCVVRRQQTNTPLQALVLLNDPQFLEASRVLSENLMESDSDLETRIHHAYLKLTGRKALPAEISILRELYAVEQAKFTADDTKTQGWLVGSTATPSGEAAQELAAMTVVVSAIMNSDAAIMLR